MQTHRTKPVFLVALLMILIMAPRAWADTAYVANEQSVTISVIDTNTDTVTATIGLGSDPAITGTPQPDGPLNGEADHHKPFYNGHVDPHGLWLTPDGSILLVACRISGTVVAIDTATNNVLGYTPVGREPHLATVHPNGDEAWVAVRGEDYIDVLKLDDDDLFKPGLRRTDRMEITNTISTMRGPSMVSFTSNGQFGFVVSGKEAVVQKINASTHKVIASAAVPAPFSPFGLVTPDDQELYIVHKGAGTLSILRTSDLGAITTLNVGPRANHIFFVGGLAYVTIGGPAPSPGNPDPEGKIVIIDRATRAIVNQLTGPAFKGEPHAIWSTEDQSKLYVGHERGNQVTVIVANGLNDASDDKVLTTISDPFIKRPIDIVVKP
ncbi:YncE family protein [Methylobacter luteus]|uniref:YncE family protein n=1 Tax=Methylobacter luteus TaxID=415 RepID=UPI0004064CC8|nr:hypothetical protein [Methylobacter luteus]